MPDVWFKDLCIDASRPELVGPFWASLLALTAQRQDGGDYLLAGDAPVWVNTVPEPLEGKNRVHLDLRFPDGSLPKATLVRGPDDGIAWTIMADPDGLQFCVFGPHRLDPEAAGGPLELVVDAVDPLRVALVGRAHGRHRAPTRRNALGLDRRRRGFPLCVLGLQSGT